jgi:hypothetical protein
MAEAPVPDRPNIHPLKLELMLSRARVADHKIPAISIG